MSCLSRLVGLICVIVPGLLFLAFSARFFFLWPHLGFVVGPLYSLVSLVTGIVCLYLGLGLLLGQKEREENASAVGSSVVGAIPESPRRAATSDIVSNSARAESIVSEPTVSEPVISELVAAPLPEPLAARADDAYIEAAPRPLESAPRRDLDFLQIGRIEWNGRAPRYARSAHSPFGRDAPSMARYGATTGAVD